MNPTPPPQQPRKYRRTQWVVNPYLQYRLIIIWCFSMVTIFGLLYYAIIKIFSELTNFVRQSSLENSQELLLYVQEQNRILVIYVLLGFFLLVLIFIYVQLSETNRIAGPIFNLIRKMRISREQGKLEPVKFRQNDYFPELADEYNSLVESFNNKDKSDPE